MDFKISTITISTQLPDCQLNLTNIGKYLDIDNEIVGIKYNYADLSIMKGKYSTSTFKKSKNKNVDKIKKTLFYNQITLVLNNNGNNVNVKLFGNGSLHITGCKSEIEGIDVTKTIYSKLKSLIDKRDILLLTKDENGVLLDKDKLIYSFNNYSNIGYKKENKYILNKKEYVIDNKTGMFISVKMENKRKRSILNLNGELIGHTKIELFKNRNKFYKNNNNIFIDYQNNFIYYNNNILIGKIEYNINFNNNTHDTVDVHEIDFFCNPFKNTDIKKLDGIINDDTKIKSLIDFNVNCINIYFSLNYEINRQRLFNKLVEHDYICKYKPESYSGIKLIYKYGLNNIKNGICSCSDKCTCTNITFLIFQSGNIIVTGFKNTKEIDNILNNFIEYLSLLKENIQKKNTE